MFSRSSLFRIAGIGALTCALAGGAFAEVAVGDKAVPIQAEKIVNTKFKSLKELKGSLILYEYFAHW